MKRLFTMGLALLMVLTMVPMSCHASNLDAGIGAESVMLPNDFDISESISVEIIFGDQDDAFSLLGNA